MWSVFQQQTALSLSPEDRAEVERIRGEGLHLSHQVNRAHVLWCLDRRLPEAQILSVLGIGWETLWRTRADYLQGGLKQALRDLTSAG
ncbi:MAG: hypothetical protein J0L58_19180 [Burkholderiales bacterium]|uniref:helix-turn-helix domain-containing protein n=1 Tax=Inhella sp. TaxID=1921806 RepID=UPI001AD54A76|nr:hypothetical protein [Burkholderiales bacterium]